jgi:hypothetical protein
MRNSQQILDWRAASRIYAPLGAVGRNGAAAAAWSLQSVYDLAAIDSQ